MDRVQSLSLRFRDWGNIGAAFLWSITCEVATGVLENNMAVFLTIEQRTRCISRVTAKAIRTELGGCSCTLRTDRRSPIEWPRLRQSSDQVRTGRCEFIVYPASAADPRDTSFSRRLQSHQRNKVPNICVKHLFVGGVGRVTDTTLFVSVTDPQVFYVSKDRAGSILLPAARANM